MYLFGVKSYSIGMYKYVYSLVTLLGINIINVFIVIFSIWEILF